MNTTKKSILLLAACSLLAGGNMGTVLAGDPIIYPAKGQSPEQQQQDEQQCRTWAIDKTGVDPANLPAVSAPAAPQDRKVLKGAAAGAAIGGLGGSLGGEFGKGAGAGALVGAVVGGVRKRKERSAAEAAQQQAVQQQQQKVQEFNRAYGACLEGRGYTVK